MINDISTKRCTISRLDENDIDEAVNLFIDDRVREFLGGSLTSEQAITKLKGWVVDETSYYFCIRLSDTNAFIGLVYVCPYHDKDYKELSYEFLPDYWNKGYAAEVIEKVLVICKTSLHLTEIISETQLKNERSRKLLEKLGYVVKDEIIRFGEKQLVYSYKY